MTLASLSPQAALPSPTTAVWQLGPLPIRAYALCIVLGILVACVVTEIRLRRRGVAPGAVLDIAVWSVPAGIIGARIYHVITSPELYFGAGGEPIKALYIWEGGLGIWGAVAGGAVGAWLATRQLGIPLSVAADALAPGLPLAQAVGRFGNWFNNELYGGQTTLPWGLEIHKMEGGQALRDPDGNAVLLPGLYAPTFAYEAIWNVGVALLVYLVDRRFKLGRGRAFAVYVMGYTVGRFWIELMRTDPANHILGVRLNVWTAVLVFAGALVYFLRVRGPREYVVPAMGTPAVVAPDEAKSDVSQVDVSRAAVTGPPEGGYRVVTEEQYLAFQRTGELPDEPAGGDDPGRDQADAASADAGSTRDSSADATGSADGGAAGSAGSAGADAESDDDGGSVGPTGSAGTLGGSAGAEPVEPAGEATDAGGDTGTPGADADPGAGTGRTDSDGTGPAASGETPDGGPERAGAAAPGTGDRDR